MDKFSYAIGLGIGQNLLSMGAKGIAVDDFAQAIKDVLEGNQTAISHTEARDIVNKYFAELEEKMNAANIEAGKKFLEENKKREGVVTLPSGLQYEVITEGNVGHYAKATDQVQCHYEGTLIDGTLFDPVGWKPFSLCPKVPSGNSTSPATWHTERRVPAR